MKKEFGIADSVVIVAGAKLFDFGLVWCEVHTAHRQQVFEDVLKLLIQGYLLELRVCKQAIDQARNKLAKLHKW